MLNWVHAACVLALKAWRRFAFSSLDDKQSMFCVLISELEVARVLDKFYSGISDYRNTPPTMFFSGRVSATHEVFEWDTLFSRIF